MSSWSSLLVVELLLLTAGHVANSMRMEQCKIDLFRLPGRFVPSDYQINLKLRDSLRTFEGDVDIGLHIKKSRGWRLTLAEKTINGEVNPMALDLKNIILNSDDLVVTGASSSQKGFSSAADSFCHDASNKILVVKMPEEMKFGAATLHLKFEGNVKSEAKGLFKSVVDPSEEMLATQFRPNYARRLFPCFDEPAYMATFELTVKHPPETIALSNT